MKNGRRRLVGWGFEGVTLVPAPQMLAWLAQRIGLPEPSAALAPDLRTLPAPAALPALPGEVSADPEDRLRHSRGQALPDLLRMRSGTVRNLPDAVVRPAAEEVEELLRRCSAAGVRVIPWGGGTSVTGGVNVPADGVPTISLDLARLHGLLSIDPDSRLAVLGAGTMGPELEACLAVHGFHLGHLPQSWELSTLGGWVVTRSSGQESLGNGRIEDLVAGLDLVAPEGRLDLHAMPASAAGPDLRQLVLGSEGRLGVVTRVTVRIRPLPAEREVVAWLLPGWEEGLAAAKTLTRHELGLSLLRLSDRAETEVAMATGLAERAGARLVQSYLDVRGVGSGCLMLLGAAGTRRHCRRALAAAQTILGAHGAVRLGRRVGRHWLTDRFRHPYLRDALVDRGIAVDTLETAAPWALLRRLEGEVRKALAEAAAEGGERTAVLCHLSHPYPDGASLYFTFFFRCPRDPDEAVARWARLKRAATRALVAAGGTLSHHHGVGAWHAPWLPREIGERGMALLASAAGVMDPAGVLNPHVLLDPTDRLQG